MSISDSPSTETRFRMGLVGVFAVAVLPFLLHPNPEFHSDDYILIARGVEHSPLASFFRSFIRPCWDTWTVQFYRPLFSWSFSVDGAVFGSNVWAYYLSNILVHALVSVTVGIVARRLMPLRFALGAAVLFAISPWCVNNVAWMAGRCSSTSTLLALLACLAAWRHRDRGGDGLPWLAFGLIAVGTFYRETAAFMGALLIGVDILEGHRSRRDLKRWLFLASPFLVYLVLRYLVLGTLTGGYDRHHLLRGDPATPANEHMARIGRSLLLLIVPGPNDGSWDALRFVAMAPLLGTLALMKRPRDCFRGKAGMLLLVIAAHAVPLFVVDPTVHSASSQRWYPVVMLLVAWWCLLASNSRKPKVALALLGCVAVAWGVGLDRNLDRYDAASSLSQSVRAHIEASPPGVVVLHGVTDEFHESPYFAVGLGASALPPFGSGDHVVYPISANHPLFEGEIHTLPPLGVWMEVTGTPCTLLVQDSAGATVTHDVRGFRGAAGRLLPFKKLTLHRPSADRGDGVTSLMLDVEPGLAQRLEIHFFCPSGHIVLERTPTKLGPGGEWMKDGSFTEDLSQLLEYAALFDHPGQRRAYLFLAAYDAIKGGQLIAIQDGFFALETSIDRERP